MNSENKGYTNVNVKWLMAAFVSIGLLIGFLLGGSKSPVVSTVLPLIFAILSGLSGAYLTKIDLKSEDSLVKLLLISKCTVLFVIGCLLGVYFGFDLRYPLKKSNTSDLALKMSKKNFSTEEKVKLTLLQTKLSKLNIDSKTVDSTLNTAISTYDQYSNPIPPKKIIDNLLIATSEFYKIAKPLSSCFKPYDPDTSNKRGQEAGYEFLLRQLMETESVLSKWKELPAKRVNKAVEDLDSDLKRGLSDRMISIMEKQGFDYASLIKLKNSIAIYKKNIPVSNEWPLSNWIYRDLNETIVIIKNSPTKSEQPLFEMP